MCLELKSRIELECWSRIRVLGIVLISLIYVRLELFKNSFETWIGVLCPVVMSSRYDMSLSYR